MARSAIVGEVASIEEALTPSLGLRSPVVKLQILEEICLRDPDVRRALIHLPLTYEDTRSLATVIARAIEEAAKKNPRGKPPGGSPVREQDELLLIGLEEELGRRGALSWKEINSVAGLAAGAGSLKTKGDRLKSVYQDIQASRMAYDKLLQPG